MRHVRRTRSLRCVKGRDVLSLHTFRDRRLKDGVKKTIVFQGREKREREREGLGALSDVL